VSEQPEIHRVAGRDGGTESFGQPEAEQVREETDRVTDDLAGLKSALQKERAMRRELERQLKHLGDINPEEYRKLQQQSQMLAEWEKRRAEEISSIKSEYEAQLQRVQQEKEQLARSLRETEVTYALTEAFYQAGGKRDAALAKMLAKQLLSQVNYDQHGNLVVVDQSGSPRLRDDGKPMSLLDLMNEVKNTSYGVLFDPVVSAGGSGATGSQVQVSGRKYLRTTDPYKLGQYIEAIAKGEVVVDLGGK